MLLLVVLHSVYILIYFIHDFIFYIIYIKIYAYILYIYNVFYFNTVIFSLWSHYQRLALCVRRGASTVEATMFPLQPSLNSAGSGGMGLTTSTSNTSLSSSSLPVQSSAKRAGAEDLTSVFTMKTSTGSNTGPTRSPRSFSFTPTSTTTPPSTSSTVASLEESVDSAVQLLASPPASNHALAYSVLSNGVSAAVLLLSL